MSWAAALRAAPFAVIAVLAIILLFTRGALDDAREDATEQRDGWVAEREGRESDRLAYRDAQAEAARMEAARLAAALREQERIHADAVNRFDARVAVLDRSLGGLRQEARALAAAGSQAGGEPVPGVPDATGSADAEAGVAYAPCDRACLVSLIRFDELITWIEAQAASAATD